MESTSPALRDRMRSSLKSGLRLATAGLGTLLASPTPAGPRVLTYHGVGSEPADEWTVTPRQLRAHMTIVARFYNPIPLSRLVDWVLGEGTLPERAVAVTFDDGFLDVHQHAMEILHAAGVPGTVFVAPALVSRGKDAADPRFQVGRPLMGWSHVRSLLAAGWTIGSHTNTHPVMSSLSHSAARSEILTSRECLQQRLGVTVDLLAWPYGTPGAVSSRDRELAAEAGYRASFMSVTGPLLQHADAQALPRSKILRGDGLFAVKATLRGAMDAWSHVEGSH